jgi:pentatricopeptide repeat protein
MKSARRGLIVTFAAVAFLCAAWYNPVQAPDEASLRKKALALNNFTGDDPIKAEIKALAEDASNTRPLLRVAVKMAKEDPQPFNYNGAFILARAALQLKELDASFFLHRVCFELANKLRSPQKMGQAYIGMDLTIQLYYQDKKNEQGLKASRELLELENKIGANDLIKGETYRLLIGGLIKAGKVDEARKLVDGLIKVRKTWRNVKLKAELESEIKDYAAAVKVYEEVLPLLAKDESLPNEEKTELDAEARLAIVRMLFMDKKFDQAATAAGKLLETLEKLGAGAPGKSTVLKLQIRSLALQGKVKEAESLVDKLDDGKQDADSKLDNLELKAWLAQQKGDDTQAAKLYEDLLERVKKNDKMEKDVKEEYESEIRYLLSSVYIDMDQLDKALKQLEFLLKKQPDNATYNNDLGYIWADHDMKLPEAEKLIRKALELERRERKNKPGLKPDEDHDNAAYLDSLGWVLFKLKNYPEAKKYLLEAVKDKEGQHIEILDHLGDVYMALGEKAEAVNTWKKALTLETKTRREKERKGQVEKKLKANQ